VRVVLELLPPADLDGPSLVEADGFLFTLFVSETVD